MRVRFLAVVETLLLVLGAGAAWAQGGAQAPGPGMVPAGKWQVGLATTWLASERFQDTVEFYNENGTAGSEASTNLKIRDDRLHSATVSYGLLRRLTLQARAGVAEGGKVAETLSNGLWEAKLKPVFVWGLGARGLIWEHQNGLGLTAGLSYLRWDDRGIDSWHSANGWTTTQGNVGVDGKVDYWRLEASALAHWRLGRFLPFLGVGYAYAEIEDVDTWSRPNGTWSRYDFSSQSQDRWGLLGGVQAELVSGLSLGLNFAYFTREELSLSLTWDF
jgi:opacity protein-like surface antigen